MRLLRFEAAGTVCLGVLDGQGVVSLTALGSRFPTMLSIVAGGEAALEEVRKCAASSRERLPLAAVRLLCPIERPGKYLAIGMNYHSHVAESEKLGVPAPPRQLWFNKQTTCLAGPNAPIDPGVSEMLDYEVELVAVIGRKAKNVPARDALKHVFGYTVGNDVSARDWQFHSPTFTVGKSFDTHGPIGPWIVTADEIPDPQTLRITCTVNGQLRQSSNTNQMIHNLAQQIEYLATAFTLEPGDLIASGTPDGVGVAMTPARFLRMGDIVRCEIENIGVLENRVS